MSARAAAASPTALVTHLSAVLVPAHGPPRKPAISRLRPVHGPPERPRTDAVIRKERGEGEPAGETVYRRPGAPSAYLGARARPHRGSPAPWPPEDLDRVWLGLTAARGTPLRCCAHRGR